MAMKKFLSTTKPIKIDCSIIIILASFIILFIFLAVELPKYISILWEHTRALFTFGMICVCICIKRSSHAFYSTLHGSGVGGNVDRDIFAVVLIVVNNRNWFYPFDAKSNMPKCIERDTHIMHHDTSRLSFCYFIYMLLLLLLSSRVFKQWNSWNSPSIFMHALRWRRRNRHKKKREIQVIFLCLSACLFSLDFNKSIRGNFLRKAHM